MSRTFYAFTHRYGANMTDRQGHAIGTLYGFDRLADRDAFVAQSSQHYSTNGGYREAWTASQARSNGYRNSDDIVWPRQCVLCGRYTDDLAQFERPICYTCAGAVDANSGQL